MGGWEVGEAGRRLGRLGGWEALRRLGRLGGWEEVGEAGRRLGRLGGWEAGRRLGHMVWDHLDSERENPLPPLHGLLFPISSKAVFIYMQRITHTTAFITLAGTRNSSMRDRPDDSSHHEQTSQWWWPHRLLLSINSKGSFICTIPQTE